MKTVSWLLLVSIIAVLCCTSPSLVGSASKPLFPIDAIPPVFQDEPIIIIGDTSVFTFCPGNTSNLLHYTNTTWYYINKRNPTLLEDIVIKEYETVETQPEVTATIYYPDSKPYIVPAYKIERFRFSQKGEYSSNCFVQTFSIPRYCEGTIVKVTQKHHYFKPSFFSNEFVRQPYAVLDRFCTVVHPAACSLKIRLYNTESIELDSMRATKQDTVYYAIHAKNVKPFQPFVAIRQPEKWYASVHCSLPDSGLRSNSWIELGDSYLQLIRNSFANKDRLFSFADSIKHRGPDSIAAYGLLAVRKRIRYHADMEKLHAIVPRPVDETFANGYGDCKDMASVLKVILERKGVDCGLALVTVPGTMQLVPEMPTLGAFDHVIVYYTGTRGETRFLDPTITFGKPFDSYFPLLGQYVFLLKEHQSRIAIIEPDINFRSCVYSANVVTNDSKAGITSQGTVTLSGLIAFQSFPSMTSLNKQEEFPYLKAYFQDIFNISISSADIVFTSPDSIMVSYQADFSKSELHVENGGLLLNAPTVVNGEASYTTRDYEGPKYITPLEQTDSWTIPKGFKDFEAHDLLTSIAQGTWKRVNDTTIIRKYSKKGNNSLYIETSELSKFLNSLKSFNQATLWR